MLAAITRDQLLDLVRKRVPAGVAPESPIAAFPTKARADRYVIVMSLPADAANDVWETIDTWAR